MLPDDAQLPDSLKALFRKELLEQARADDCLGLFELSLFEIYLTENTATIDRMLAAEVAYVQEQVSDDIELANDSGIVAAEYFTKRIRYADVIYLCSLIETFLENACKKLDSTLNGHGGSFDAGRGGGKWERCKEFLEGHGGIIISGLLWEVIQATRTVRHCIVHDNGDTAGLTGAEKAFLFSQVGLRVSGYEVVVESEFVCRALDAFKELVFGVNSELNKVIDSQLRALPMNADSAKEV